MLALDHMPGTLASIRKKLRQTHLLDHHISMHHWQLSSFVVVIKTRISVRQFFICPMVSKGASENFPESERTPHISHLYLTIDTNDFRPPTLHLRPRTRNPPCWTSDLRPSTSSHRPQTSDLASQCSDLRPHTSHLRVQTSDLRAQTIRPQTSMIEPETSKPQTSTSVLTSQTSDFS